MPCAFHVHENLFSVIVLCFKGFFIYGFPKLKRFQEHHNHVLKRFLPKIKKHLVLLVFSL